MTVKAIEAKPKPVLKSKTFKNKNAIRTGGECAYESGIA